MSSRKPVRQDLLVKAPAGGVGFGARLFGERSLELLVLGDGLPALSGDGVQTHQAQARLFVGRLAGYYLPERLDGRPVFLTLLVEPGQLDEQREVGFP